jgi:hypothetical protein
MIVTDIKTCKERMTNEAFNLLCKHKREDQLEPWDPEIAPNKETICLTKTEVLQYEY